MATIKDALIPRRVRISKFQIISIIFLLLFIVCDVFILQLIPSFSNHAVKWFYWFFLQFIICIICLCQNYTGFCFNLRKAESLRQRSISLKPQPPAFIQILSNSPSMVMGLYVIVLSSGIVGWVSFKVLEQVFPVHGVVFTMISIITVTLFVLAGNIFQFQCTTKADASQVFETKIIFKLIAVERTPLLKTLLQFNLIINVGFCIYTFCMDRAAVFFILFQYPIIIVITLISLYYMFLNVRACIHLRIGFLEEILEVLLWSAFVCCVSLLTVGYYFFTYALPFWGYFLLFSVVMAFTLFLNKFGNYPFVDYELFDPNYVCFLLLWKSCQQDYNVCQFCEYRNECVQHSRNEDCYFGSDPSHGMY